MNNEIAFAAPEPPQRGLTIMSGNLNEVWLHINQFHFEPSIKADLVQIYQHLCNQFMAFIAGIVTISDLNHDQQDIAILETICRHMFTDIILITETIHHVPMIACRNNLIILIGQYRTYLQRMKWFARP